MSYASVAAALDLDPDLGLGERAVAFALASFANREHRAWPGTRLAAARAGLSRSQYLASRDLLVTRGLVAIEDPGGGRGNAPVLRLRFAETGSRIEADVNPQLFESVLSYSRARGGARVLLAALAGLADDSGVVANVTTDQLRTAAGIADSTYRRARAALLDSGQVALDELGGGRAITNRWIVRDPRRDGAVPLTAAMPRPTPRGSARPLLAEAHPDQAGDLQLPLTAGEAGKGPGIGGDAVENPGQTRTEPAENRPGSSGVNSRNPAQNRTSTPETPPQTPPETPPLYVRAGNEPPNHPTIPPNPPNGGNPPERVTVIEDFVTDRGRRRQRTLTVNVAAVRRQLHPPKATDHEAWGGIRDLLRAAVGESTFEIWLAGLQLVAVDEGDQLVLAVAQSMRAWIADRYGQVLRRAGAKAGRPVRLADDREIHLLAAIGRAPSPCSEAVHLDHQEAV